MGMLARRIASRYVQALTIPREYHLPPGARDKPPIQPEGTDLYIWTWEGMGTSSKGPVERFYGIAFAGKANKPLWYYTFLSEESRQKEIDRTIASRKGHIKLKQDQADERKNYKHDYEVGDVAVASWGYDQTNVNFYQIVGVVGTQVVIREIGSKIHDQNQNITHVVPVKDHFIGPPLRRKVSLGARIQVDNVQGAHKWDGKPVYETTSGWGH